MAPLTWRNVDAPSFSGANDMWRTAASLLNQGLDRARQGLADYRDIETAQGSNALMQQVIAAGNDPTKINAAVTGANPAYLNPEALKFANAQPGVLLDREGKALDNTGAGLSNTIRGQSIRANDFNFDRTKIEAGRKDADYAQLPEALGAIQTLRSDMASADPNVAAGAQARQADVLTKYGRSLGITDMSQLGSFMNGNLKFSNDTMDNNTQRLRYAAGLDDTMRSQDAKGIVANVLGMTGNDADRAITMAQGFKNLDPQTQVDVINQLNTYKQSVPGKSATDKSLEAADILTGKVPSAPVLPSTYQPVVMANQGKRNLPLNSNLNAALNAVLPNLGLTAVVTSGGQSSKEEFANGTATSNGYTGSTRHVHGGAADVKFRTADGHILSWERPADVPLLQKAVSDLKGQGLTGFGAAGDYMGPETTHVGYGTPAVWGKEGGGKPYQALMDAYNGAASKVSSNAGPTVERAAASNNAPRYQAAMDAISSGKTFEAPIDPTRVRLQNPDGTVSTERTFTTQVDGAWMNIPSIVNGQRMSEEDALKEFRSGNNPPVGVYDDLQKAEAAAKARTDNIGQMLDAAAGNAADPAATSNTAQNDTLTTALSPSLDQTTKAAEPEKPAAGTKEKNVEVKVDDRWTIPSVDPNAPQAKQDLQTAQRNAAIDGVMTGIRTGLAVDQGGSVGSNFAQSTWDYFMSDPKTAEANAASRTEATKTLDWFNSEVAKKHFRDNPEDLVAAKQDPVNFVNNFKAPDPTKEAATAAVKQAAANAPAPKQEELTLRKLTDAETIDQKFATVRNHFSANAVNDPYSGLTAKLQDGTNKNESPAETAKRLSDAKGPFTGIAAGEITKSIRKLMDDLPTINAATAGALMEYTSEYSDGLLGIGKGFSIDTDQAKEIWSKYQKGESLSGVNGAINRMNSVDFTEAQQTALKTLEEKFKAAETSMKAIVADTNSTEAQKAAANERLKNIKEYANQQLTQIITSGGATSNLIGRTGK